jgi:signal transduction histidine kinase
MIDLPLDDLLNGFGEPLILCDEDGLVVNANSAATRFFRMSVRELADAPVDTWLHDDRGLLWPRLGQATFRELVFRDGDGTNRTTHGSIQPMPVHGAMGWMIRLEDPAGHAQILHGLESMAGGIALQLASQLTLILQSASELLLSGLSEERATHVRTILSAAENSATLQRQLQAVAGQGEPRRPARLSKVFSECEPLLESVLGPNIRLLVRYHPDGDDVLLDLASLRLALVRLGEWISKQTPPPTTVWATVQGDADNTGTCLLKIVDDGPGVEASVRNRLFEPYSGPGEDLGLAVVFGVVERHQGRLLVDSTPGRGTAFHIEFDTIDPQSHPPENSVTEGSETILVIEDDAATLEMVTAALEGQGYEVLPAQNGIEASVLLRRDHQRIDVVLADAVVPGRSGIEVAVEARQFKPNMPVLLMTGYSAEFLGPHLCDDLPILRKPFSPHELIRRLRSLLDEHSAST